MIKQAVVIATGKIWLSLATLAHGMAHELWAINTSCQNMKCLN